MHFFPSNEDMKFCGVFHGQAGDPFSIFIFLLILCVDVIRKELIDQLNSL